MRSVDVVIVGGGPAGLAAAVSAKNHGAGSILILERDSSLGGILNQCIHSGFGLHRFKEELTGPEYANRYIQLVEELGIPYLLNTTVIDITPDRKVTAVNSDDGVIQINAGAIIIAAGCRERPAGAINIFGDRCAGIYTAGTAQKFVNIDGYMPGKKIIILGSGDIGLIMARRMTLEGAKVEAVIEIMPFSSGLNRNIVQCLNDFNIPLYLSHTITSVKGKERLESVVVAEVDKKLKPIKGTEREVECDTLLLSVGLLPENEMSKKADVVLSGITGGAIVNERFETSTPGIFACGNVLHVHDLVDYVSEESERAARYAVDFAAGRRYPESDVEIKAGNGVRYTVPFKMSSHSIEEDLIIRFRVNNRFKDKKIRAFINGEPVISKLEPALAPGEMQTIVISRDKLEKVEKIKDIMVEVSD